MSTAIEAFYEIRNMKELSKLPSTSELLDWLKALMLGGVDVSRIGKEIPYIGVLLKKDQDVEAMEDIRTKGFTLRNW